MYRVTLITKTGEHKSENFKTREEVDTFILKNEAVKYFIGIKKPGEKINIIESEKGVMGNEKL